MKDFIEIELDRAVCRQQWTAYRDLLESKPELAERADILPFFAQHEHLSALIGTYSPYVYRPDRVAFEYELFGEYVCDLVIGDSAQGCYCFVEFEDATSTSIFRRTHRWRSEWASRYEHGFSQIVDWLYALDDNRATTAFVDRFGRKDIKCSAIMIIGRSHYLNDSEKRRLRWRHDRIMVDSKPVFCFTFDEVLHDLGLQFALTKALYPDGGRQ
jgi:antiviral defense system Shedu protein SduA